MRSSPDYQNCTWRSIQTTGTDHGPRGHASWMERRWGSQNISHWCDSVGKKWDNSGVEKVVQTWVSYRLIWLLLGPQVLDTLLPHPPMELVPAPQNIQQEEVARFTTPLIASLPRMCLISPLTPLYQLHLMEAPVAGIIMTNEFQQDMEKCDCASCLLHHTAERRELGTSVAAEFRHHCQGLARCRDIRINILRSPPPHPLLQTLFAFYMWLSLKGLATSSGIIDSHSH